MDTDNRILGALDKIRNLPTLPAVVQKVGELINDPNADAKRIASVIEDDPAIMTRILKVVNSVLYAGSEEVVSVQQAVARLGMRTVNNIAMATSVFSAFDKSDGEELFNREEFWRHSISCGIAACVVYDRAKGQLSGRLAKDELRLAGLVHDIGKIILDQYFHDDFTASLHTCREQKIPLVEAEREVMGTDHCEVGAWLGKKWNLSAKIIAVIEKHHEPEDVDEKVWPFVAVCHTANYICNQQHIGDGGDTVAPAMLPGEWKKMGLSIADIADVEDAVNEEAANSEILMGFAKG